MSGVLEMVKRLKLGLITVSNVDVTFPLILACANEIFSHLKDKLCLLSWAVVQNESAVMEKKSWLLANLLQLRDF